MLRIQVLGNGLIPRGHGIAPKKEPFPADLKLIGVILSTGGLKVNFVHPHSGKLVSLTRENYQAMYAKYANLVYTKAAEAEGSDQEGTGEPNHTSPIAPVAPVVPEVPIVPQAPVIPVTPPVAETTPETPVAAPVVEEAQATDDAKTEEFTMKPIVAPEEKPKNFQNNKPYNQQNGGQRQQNANQR